MKITTKTLRGKYQITKDIYVACYLDILEATDKEIKTFVGLKKRADSTLPAGTRIYFDAEVINKINVRRSNSFDIFWIKVLGSGNLDGKPLHICTTINKETRPNLRGEDRKEAAFPVYLAGSGAEFKAVNGTVQGLTLLYEARKAVLSLAVGHEYEFSVNYKDRDYLLPAVIKHIQYDRREHEHLVGIQFAPLGQELETIVRLLLDPDYKIQISDRHTVDTALGKISRGDMLADLEDDGEPAELLHAPTAEEATDEASPE